MSKFLKAIGALVVVAAVLVGAVLLVFAVLSEGVHW